MNTFGFFWNEKSGLFLIGKAWLWKNMVWAAYSVQISSEKSLYNHAMCTEYWKDFTVAQKMIYVIDLIRNKYTTV